MGYIEIQEHSGLVYGIHWDTLTCLMNLPCHGKNMSEAYYMCTTDWWFVNYMFSSEPDNWLQPYYTGCRNDNFLLYYLLVYLIVYLIVFLLWLLNYPLFLSFLLEHKCWKHLSDLVYLSLLNYPDLSPRFKNFGSSRNSLNPTFRPNLWFNSDDSLCYVIISCNIVGSI